MKSINKILIPFDLKSQSLEILKQAVEIARYANAQLVILHVYHKPVVSKNLENYADMDIVKALEKSKLKRLLDKKRETYDNMIHSIPDTKEIHTKFIKTQGLIVDKIIEVNEQEKIDLIVMGTRGVRGIEEFWGTKAAEICLKLKTPVLILPYQFKLLRPNKIAFAYDLKAINDIKILDVIKLFSMVYQSEVHIISIHSDKKLSSSEEENMEFLKEHFQEFKPVWHMQYGGEVEDGIYRYLKDEKISMLVVLHRSRGFLEGIFKESLTEKIAYHSDIPVLALDDRDEFKK